MENSIRDEAKNGRDQTRDEAKNGRDFMQHPLNRQLNNLLTNVPDVSTRNDLHAILGGLLDHVNKLKGEADALRRDVEYWKNQCS